jgi:HK97 family phage prohead protease
VTGRLTAAAEWKTLPGDSGELSGYMSVFNVLDEGGDVAVPGCFRKTFSDWNGARSPMPLIADHELSTEGVIGSVSHLAEDATGAQIRARFSSIAKAQDIRTKMAEGHLRGMSFTYEAIRHHRGTFGGKSARFLDEVRVFEATVTPFPMNALALASAKGTAGDIAADLAELGRLELWARAVTAEGILGELCADGGEAMAGVGALLADRKAHDDLAALEQWASRQPRVLIDPGEPLPLSRAELAHREAVSRARFSPPARCGVCWRCQINAGCAVYR